MNGPMVAKFLVG